MDHGWQLRNSPLRHPGSNHRYLSIVKGLETAHVRPLKRVRTPRAILVTSCYELSQFRAPEKERTRKIKEEEDASSRSYEIFNNRITFWK